MFIRGKKPHYFPPSADCLQFLLVLCSLSIPVEIRLHVICIFVPSPWKMTFTFCSDQIPAGSGSARQGSRVGSRQFSVIFLICSVPWQALALFLRWSWTFTFLSVFFPSLIPLFLFPLSFAVGWGTQSFWGKCKLQAALSSFCFLIGKQHFRELHRWQGSAKTSRVQEYSLFPGPGCVEVGLSEEGAFGREGR